MSPTKPKLEETEFQIILKELADEPFKMRPEEIAYRTGAANDTVYRWMRGAMPLPIYRTKLRAIHREYKRRHEKREEEKNAGKAAAPSIEIKTVEGS